MRRPIIAALGALLCVPVLMAGGCDDEWAMPPPREPRYDGPAPNRTLAQVRAQYDTMPNRALIEEDYIVGAVITANDASGNLFKQLYIADGTGAVAIGIDQSGLAASNRVGQRVVVRLRGMAAVRWGGEMQLGWRGTYANRIPWVLWPEHASFDGWPDPLGAVPLVTTLPEIAASEGAEMVGALVELCDVRFVMGGVADFTEDNAPTSRVIADREGRTMEVRTSDYADFATERLPVGYGTLVGILTRYDDIWQLTLRSLDDVRFTGGAE